MGRKIKKIAAGLYQTTDGKFTIRNSYDPSGSAHVRCGRGNWLLKNNETGKSQIVPGLDTAKILAGVK